VSPSLAPSVWIAALARASAFAALAPLAGSGAVPRVVRAALALTLVPAIAAHLARSDAVLVPLSWLREAAMGAAFGIAASIIASAASAGGSLVDGSLALRPFGRETVFRGAGGPFERIYSLAFAAVFVASGALTHLCGRFVAASSIASAVPAASVPALVGSMVEISLDLAAPAIAAQVLGTLVAAAAARASPRVNGLMLASPVVTTLAMLAIFACLAPTMRVLADLASRAAVVHAAPT